MERAEVGHRGVSKRRRLGMMRRDMGDGGLDPAVSRSPAGTRGRVEAGAGRIEARAESEATGAGVPDGLAVSLGVGVWAFMGRLSGLSSSCWYGKAG